MKDVPSTTELRWRPKFIAVIADKPEKNNAPAMPGGDGGMGGMDF